MNGKLTGYLEAKKRLSELSDYQRYCKKGIKTSPGLARKSSLRSLKERSKKEINMLLSLVAAHKKARLMFGRMREMERKAREAENGF